jgi:hypothetical protein
MIGYMIGLGDRHLDNVLVDLKSGQVKKKFFENPFHRVLLSLRSFILIIIFVLKKVKNYAFQRKFPIV